MATAAVPPSSDTAVGPASGRGRRHGTSTSVPFDRWFRYPAGFASDYVTALLANLDISPGGVIIDCFTGSGVTGTAARQAGYGFYGIEAHPLIAELAQLKLQSPPETPSRLAQEAARTVEAARSILAQRLRSGKSRAEDQPDLIRRSFDGQHLEQLVALRDLIKLRDDEYAPYLKWALLAALRDVASVKVGWPYQRPAVSRKPVFTIPMQRFVERAILIEEDLQQDQPLQKTAIVLCGDARDSNSWGRSGVGLSDGCVASPPYLNNFDYADATRLELYFWGEVTTWAQLCSGVRRGMITATTQQSSVLAASRSSERLMHLPGTGEQIGVLTKKLEMQRKSRDRGKEYDRVLPDYFAGILQVLQNLALNLKPGAPCVWLVGDSAPYGVYVDTPAIIGDIAGHLGFKVESDVVLRHRGQRWGTNKNRHSVSLGERLLRFRLEEPVEDQPV
ncbi:DNA methyltransferase [Plantactinospora sp. WMMC1484]|uniref:DNA methyltransferase n=1 Tax=Plantactinospora sp. WMMC1484 TaxID=3404122 RepID=UPI003BF50A9A